MSSSVPAEATHHYASSTGPYLYHPLECGCNSFLWTCYRTCFYLLSSSVSLSRFYLTSSNEWYSRRLERWILEGLCSSSEWLPTFVLNVVSFTANKKVGALSMTVAGESAFSSDSPRLTCYIANVKQALMIVIAIYLVNLSSIPINALGILLTLVGCAWCASVEYKEKCSRTGHANPERERAWYWRARAH